MKKSAIGPKMKSLWRSRVTLVLGCLIVPMSASGDSGPGSPASATAALPPSGQVYVVETARFSGGRLFLAPMEPREGVSAGTSLAARGALLSRTTSGSRRIRFSVTTAGGKEVYSVDVTVEVEPGSVPFGFEWSTLDAPEGDYVARLLVSEAILGEDARAEWRVSVRNAAAVAARVEAARAEVARLRESTGDTMPAQARQALALAEESLAPFPAVDRPLIEADENAHFAMTTASHVRAGLTFGQFRETAESPGSDAVSALTNSSPFSGAFVFGASANLGQRASGLGFDFVPWIMTEGAAAPGGELPTIVWLPETTGEMHARSAEELQLAKAAGHVSAVSLWMAPHAPEHDVQTVGQFRKYVEGVYGDRVKMNRAWKQHLFSFDEVEFWPGIDNRAYQYDVQTFERHRTSQWLLDAIHAAELMLAPAAATITFTDGLLVPGEARLGLDAEALAPTVAVVPVRITGPLDDARYVQRYPAASVVYALFRSFAPDKPLLALQSLDFDLNDRLRMDSAGQLRTLAAEAAIEGVSELAIEMPAFGDVAAGAPEAVAGFAKALHELHGAREAIAAFSVNPAPVAVLWRDRKSVV